jgi:hypothetical protein
MFFLRAWFNLSGEGMADAIYDSNEEQVSDSTMLCKFRKLPANNCRGRLPQLARRRRQVPGKSRPALAALRRKWQFSNSNFPVGIKYAGREIFCLEIF